MDVGYCLNCNIGIEVHLCCSGRDCGCMGMPVDVPVCSEECYISWEKSRRAFQALLEYEKNCILKYDYTDDRPSKRPIPSETMGAYAQKYMTTIREMKIHWREVENELKRQRLIK